MNTHFEFHLGQLGKQLLDHEVIVHPGVRDEGIVELFVCKTDPAVIVAQFAVVSYWFKYMVYSNIVNINLTNKNQIIGDTK